MMGGEDQPPSGGQTKSMQIPKRWPLANQPSNRSTDVTKDARLVNCYAEKDPNGQGYEIEKRWGLDPTVAYSPTPGNGRGMFLWQAAAGDQRLIYVNGLQLNVSQVNTFPPPATISTGAPIALGGTFRFAPIASSPATIMLGPGSVAGSASTMYYLDTTNALRVIVDPDFPNATVPGIVSLDGFLYVMTPLGAIYNSTFQDDPTQWNALNFIQANNIGDLGVGLAAQLTYLVALKQNTTQFFYDAGNPVGSPLSPVVGAQLNYGCLSADSIQDIDDALFWVTSSKTSSCQVVMLKNLQPTIVSTPAIDKILDQFRTAVQFSDHVTPPYTVGFPLLHSFALKYAGHKFYSVTCRLATVNITLVYDIDQGLWSEWYDYQGNYYPYFSPTVDLSAQAAGGPALPSRLIQHVVTGQVYIMGADYVYPNDGGSQFIPLVDIYTPNFDAGVDRGKMLSQMRFNTDQVPQSQLLIRSSDDDYQTWSSFRSVSLNQKTPAIADEGTFYRRAYNFRHQSNTKFRISSVDLQMDLGML